MKEKWKRLNYVSNLILTNVPIEIISEYRSLLPAKRRLINLEEKINLYYFYIRMRQYVSKRNRYLLGEFLSTIDELSA